MTDSSRTLTLVQMTDCHLFADPAARMHGVATDASLQAVIDLVAREQSVIDILLLSGDLSQDASGASYRRARQHAERLPTRHQRWLPGNHDAPASMHQACRDTDYMSPCLDLGNWRLILLDSTVPGDTLGLGRLAPETLATLDRYQESAGNRHILVALHHPPLPVGSAWIDAIGLQQPEALLQRLDSDNRIRGLICGHVHQQQHQQRKHWQLFTSPSTGSQFMPGSTEFALDPQAAGYRWFSLHDDGLIESGISRLPTRPA